MNPKRILIYNSNEPLPQQGGMERVTDILARGLKESGHDVHLLCRQKNRLGLEYHSPVAIHFFPKNTDNRTFFENIIRLLHIEYVIDQTEGEIIGRYGIYKSRRELPIAIKLIAVQHNSIGSILRNFRIAFGKNYGKNPGGYIKSFIYNGCLLHIKKLHSVSLNKKLHRELAENYDKIVLLSNTFITDFIKLAPNVAHEKLTAISDPNTYQSPRKTCGNKKILFVGRLRNEAKGVDKLLKIWHSIESKYPSWSLDIVGDGPDRASLEAQANSLRLKRVKFHGHCDPTPFYEQASIFCMTSIYEGFGMVLTEAMQHGVVPIAFDSYNAVHDIIDDGENGFLVRPFDLNQYVSVLLKLIENNNVRERMSNAAIDKSKTFSIENIIAQWNNLLDTI